ncbi:MAG: hypothetical protein GX564_06380, partial [Oligosphaeraceae bacterium]|nr:hypothetical protein [Oligosphaeraceae bacterium]
MTVSIFLLSLAAAAISGFADETAELQQNWSALQERNIELLPIPKHLSLARPQTLTKLVISGMATARYRAAMIEELSSRISELGLQVTVSNAPEPATDAYNIILATWDDSSAAAAMVPDNGDSRFAQAYTLTPGDHRLILSGKSDLGLLYAVVTLRSLIQNDNGQAVIHPATVADWPDFATRRCGLQFNPLGSPSRRDPEEFLANMKAALKWALRHKINAISQLPYIPQYSNIRRLNAKSPHFDAVLAARLKQVTDFARANGILAGRVGNFISVAEADNPEDAADPRFKDLLLFNRRHIATWGHLDWHQEINRRYADFFRASGFSFFNHHTVDSGGANDPALWSKRDAETRRLYGDDRVKADIALWTAVADCFKGLDMDFSITQYPYSGKYLTLEGIREVLHLPDNNTARETAQKILARNLDYLN